MRRRWVCRSRVERSVVVFEDRLDKGSEFRCLEAVADDREDGGRRGGRVELRYALAEKVGERNGASAGSDKREDEEEGAVVVGEAAGGIRGVWGAIKGSEIKLIRSLSGE